MNAVTITTMKKCFSSSYTNNNENWAIICPDQKNVDNKFTRSQLYGLYCVVQNIIQRGAPTKPSEYLKTQLGELDDTDETYLISDVPSYWDMTIKGDVKNSDYPAAVFFNERVPEHLKEYAFIRNLMIPEADFDEILDKRTAFSGQQVDFFLPEMSLVIEIDGGQHHEYKQRQKDKERDKELDRYGIITKRISAKDVRQNTPALQAFFESLKQEISKNEVILHYKRALDSKPNVQFLRYESVLRLQLLLLTCLREQRLDIKSNTWMFSILDSDVEGLEELLDIAYSDLKLWMTHISALMKLHLDFPALEITKDNSEADLCIDCSLFKRYDDTCIPSEKNYYIRTDYYPNSEHYRIAVTDTISYKIEPEESTGNPNHLRFLLRNIFGYEDFQDGQLPIIINVLEGNDTIGILPTGAGKSLCYQLCAMLQPGVTLIVDPILSLMQDQKRSMSEKNITHNEMIASNLDGAERGLAIEHLAEGRFQMVWISPERFQSEEFRMSLAQINYDLNFCLAVIDEVHCLSEWGHDFRVSYLTLTKTLRRYCPAALLLGLTATASEFVLTDIRAEFGEGYPLEWENIKTSPSMDRKELSFIRVPVHDETERSLLIQELIRRKIGHEDPDAGLIFCPTIGGRYTGCNAIEELLNKNYSGKFRLFNGKIDQEKKAKNQSDFIKDVFPLMICTKAFGMGVDKQNLRFTIHDSLPASIESFYQEAGRAGRDRQNAECYIIYNIDNATRKTVDYISSNGNLLELLKEEDTFEGNDLQTTLFFFNSNHMSEDEETDYIFSLFQFLKAKPTGMKFQQSNPKSIDYKQKAEHALYKLSLLGFVDDWTIKYYSLKRGAFFTKTKNFSDISVLDTVNRFLAYVRKYDVEFSLQSGNGLEYQEIFEQPGNQVRNVIRMLVRWTNQNILYQRLQCSKTIMDWCSPSVDDDTFRRNLEGYFRFSDETVTLEYIAYHPTDYRRWFDILFELNSEKTKRTTLITKEAAQESYASLQRFLESYQNNTGLNYLDGLLQLLSKDEISEHDLDRMKRSLRVIRTLPIAEHRGIIRRTVLFGKSIKSIEKRDILSRTILEYFPELSKMVFDEMQDRYSLSIELDKYASRMESIKWII